MTQFQHDLLYKVKESSSLDHESFSAGEKRSLLLMQEKGCVNSVEYANGLHWEMTDLGFQYLQELQNV